MGTQNRNSENRNSERSTYETNFREFSEFSDGTLVFDIVNGLKELAGFSFLSSEGDILIIEGAFYDQFSDNDRKFLKKQMELFRDFRKKKTQQGK